MDLKKIYKELNEKPITDKFLMGFSIAYSIKDHTYEFMEYNFYRSLWYYFYSKFLFIVYTDIIIKLKK